MGEDEVAARDGSCSGEAYGGAESASRVAEDRGVERGGPRGACAERGDEAVDDGAAGGWWRAEELRPGPRVGEVVGDDRFPGAVGGDGDADASGDEIGDEVESEELDAVDGFAVAVFEDSLVEEDDAFAGVVGHGVESSSVSAWRGRCA